MPLSNLILALNTGCLFFLFFINTTRKTDTNRSANFWLSIFLVSVALASLGGSMLAYGLDVHYPHLFKLTDLTAFAMAPSLFLATKYFTRPEQGPVKKDWLHFLPVLSFFAINGKYFLVLSPEELAAILESSPNKDTYNVLTYALVVQCTLYLILAFLLLYRYHRDRKKYDATNARPLKWLLNALLGIAAMFVLWVADSNGLFAGVISVGYAACSYYLGYWTINQREVFPYSDANRSQLTALLSKRDIADKKKEMGPRYGHPKTLSRYRTQHF